MKRPVEGDVRIMLDAILIYGILAFTAIIYIALKF